MNEPTLFDDLFTGAEDEHGIQPVIAPVMASSGFESRLPPPVRAAQDGSDAGSTVHQGSASLVGCVCAVDEGATVKIPSHTSGDSRERPATWNEVPQPLFDSWSLPRQLAYCAARDEDAAATVYDPEWAAFYTARAASYRRMMCPTP